GVGDEEINISTDFYYEQTSAPSDTGGTIWFNTTNEQFYINENGSWVKPRTYNDIFSLPINLNYDEGRNAPFFKKTTTANCTETFVSNTDLYSDYYEYKRRWTGTGIGSCFIYQTHFDIMTTGNTIFSWGFWVKDSDILDVMTTSKNFEYWLYHGGILANPSYKIKTIIEGDVGTRLSGTDTSTNLTSCKWESYSIDRKSGYTYIVNNIYDMVWNPSFTISNLYFYIIFNDFDELLNGKTIDTIGHTILIDEKISKPYVYPDINGKQQYPFNIEDNYNKIVDLDTRVSVLEAGIDTGTTSDTFVRLDLPYLYVRTHLNDTQDLLQVFNVNLTSGNSQVNFNAEYIFPSGTSYTTATMTNSANLVKSSGDDACPSNYNSTYIGANHGPSKGITVTSHTHGKDDTDVGSVYRDVDLVEWTILKIVDADTLVVISENIGASSEIWNYDTSINGDLTNYIGGTHTGDITVDSQVFGLQLKPIIKNHTIKYLIDGKTDIYGIEGDYYCDYINIVEEYDICNIESSVEYVRNNPGVAQELINGDAQVHQQVMYKIKNNGCDIYTSWTTKQSINVGYFGFIQSSNVNTTLYDSYLMVP
ncbi:MAG: hypothetical protein KC589_08275, partial [Nanoarchaeota archaeon]|nr:hypothetical protein [Nanoarchaeota archaeon]